MPFYTQLSTCMNRHRNDAPCRFDPLRSDANFSELFCSLRCEKEWIELTVANLTLSDVVDIQARASIVMGLGSTSVRVAEERNSRSLA